jgi:hypothetical protein
VRWSAEHDGLTKASVQFIGYIRNEYEVLFSEIRDFFAGQSMARAKQ